MQTGRVSAVEAFIRAVLVLAGAGALGVAIVIAGLRYTDDAVYQGPLTEAAYVAVAVAALSTCGFGCAVALRVVAASIRTRTRREHDTTDP